MAVKSKPKKSAKATAALKAMAGTATKAAAANGKKPRASREETRGRGAEWTFPQDPLEDAIRVPKAIEEKHAGRPMPASILAKAVGFNRSNDWRFRRLLKSANSYGLVSGSGATATVSLAKIGQDIVAPSSPSQRQAALLEAFRQVEDFKKVEEFYRGKRIPEDEFIQNTLVREFGIPRDRVATFQEVFLKNIDFLKAFQAQPPVDAPPSSEQTTHTQAILSPDASLAQSHLAHSDQRVREFLDTCFVMMPFGDWFNTYYVEVYSPAIREAGYEPVRSDELFRVGSVVEQIWQQIQKASVLVADLTGKNPNVFYELGLAHAASKPVVLLAASVDDIPFDLRHLRTILYDVRSPNWAAQVQREITSYLRNTRTEPDKSIPSAFRITVAPDEEGS
jgi:hypothetical protein